MKPISINPTRIDEQRISISGTTYSSQLINENYLEIVYVKDPQKVRRDPENQSVKNKSLQHVTLCIKNMVSLRCIMAIKAVLKNLELPYTAIELGKVEIAGELTESKLTQLKIDLLKLGFELAEDKKSILIEKIKTIIVAMIQYEEDLPKIKFAAFLSMQLNHNYTYLSNLFSRVKGMTIEQFIQSHKIERVKQLLSYNELTISEIAWKLNYSSVAHLSNQFKKITGQTPTNFKNMKNKRLIALENL